MSKKPKDPTPEAAKAPVTETKPAPPMTPEIEQILTEEALLPEGVYSLDAWRWRKSL